MAPPSWARPSSPQAAPASQPPFFASSASSFTNPPILPPIQQTPGQNVFSIQNDNARLGTLAFAASDRRPINHYNPTSSHRTGSLPAPFRHGSARSSSHNMQLTQQVNRTPAQNTDAQGFVNNITVSVTPAPSRPTATSTSGEISIIQHYPNGKVAISRQKRKLPNKDATSTLVPKKKAKTKAAKPEPVRLHYLCPLL
jgi:hypothetical protein